MIHRHWALVFRIGITLACVGVLVHWWYRRPSLDPMTWDWQWGGLALILSPTLLVLRALKWRACLRGLGELPGLYQCLRSYVGALPLAAVTPGRAGELARPLYFTSGKWHHLETSGRLLLDNWTDTLAVVLCTLPGCYWMFGTTGLVAGVVGFLVLGCIRPWLNLVHGLLSQLRIQGWIGKLRNLLMRLLPPAEAASPRLVSEGLTWGVLAYILESLQFLFLLRALGQPETAFIPLFSGLALIHLANSIQFTVAGIGPREGLTVWLLAQLGLSQSALIGASFLQTALIFLVPAGLGLALKPRVETLDSH